MQAVLQQREYFPMRAVVYHIYPIQSRTEGF